MAADEKLIHGRDPLFESCERHFQIFGTGRADDHLGEIGGGASPRKNTRGCGEKKLTASQVH